MVASDADAISSSRLASDHVGRILMAKAKSVHSASDKADRQSKVLWRHVPAGSSESGKSSVAVTVPPNMSTRRTRFAL